MARRRLVLRFSGTVQGVGFRYTTCACARAYDVTGYVKNLRRGDVELVAEGEREDLCSLKEAVLARMGGYVRSCDEAWCDPTGEFSSFGVAY